MDSLKAYIPDNKGNHLMVVLDFCNELYKTETLRIPPEFSDVDMSPSGKTKRTLSLNEATLTVK